ncbi:MAG: patatin-like phospholipase family protein [Gammaproteobacteria bacterium]|nr:patatin-like phospholipase family protein [Gammaproteobacteria bacterium]MCP5459971.1 patatin-like phospholipase family protein [Gammaproteobacteria bacterium]
MLRTQPENYQPTEGSRIGLALAGGGPLGVIYEIGALRALDEALESIDFNKLHVYVGVSAGSVIAANLVNHLTTADMCRTFIRDEPSEHPFNPQMFLTPAFGEYLRRLSSLPKLFFDSIWRFFSNPFDQGLLESLTSLSQAMPTGFFDNEPISRFFSQVYGKEGRSNDFRQLQQKLYVIAVELDTGESIKFGAPGYDHIPISKALQASTALPGLYPPVEIEGHHYVDGALIKTMHASVALDEGADLVICLNPIVPFDANLAAQAGIPKHDTLLDGGLPVVLSQTFRSLIHSRLEVSMAAYDSQYENADVILFEPDRDDEKMFFANVFSFSNRYWVCEHAYQTIRSDLLERYEDLEPILARHGITLRMDILEDKNRHFSTGLQEESHSETLVIHKNSLTHNFKRTLNEFQ